MHRKNIAVVGAGSKVLLEAMKAIDNKKLVLSEAYSDLKKWNDENARDTVPYSYFKNRVNSINSGTHLDYMDSIKYVVAEEKTYRYVDKPGFQ